MPRPEKYNEKADKAMKDMRQYFWAKSKQVEFTDAQTKFMWDFLTLNQPRQRIKNIVREVQDRE